MCEICPNAGCFAKIRGFSIDGGGDYTSIVYNDV